jgi:hypothetical protein
VDEGDGELRWEQKRVLIKTNGRMGLVDIESGEFIIPAIYENIRRRWQGDTIEFFQISDGGTSDSRRIDKQGNTESESGDLWGGKQGVANSKGDIIVPQLYQFVYPHGFYSISDHPVFAAYILKDLRLLWEKSEFDGYLDLKREFNEQLSSIHLYKHDGTLLRKIPYGDYDFVWKNISEAVSS